MTQIYLYICIVITYMNETILERTFLSQRILVTFKNFSDYLYNQLHHFIFHMFIIPCELKIFSPD
jgi:hypothetical protein